MENGCVFVLQALPTAVSPDRVGVRSPRGVTDGPQVRAPGLRGRGGKRRGAERPAKAHGAPRILFHFPEMFAN